MFEAVGIKICPQDQHHVYRNGAVQSTGCEQSIYVSLTSCLVCGKSKKLLELISNQQNVCMPRAFCRGIAQRSDGIAQRLPVERKFVAAIRYKLRLFS